MLATICDEFDKCKRISQFILSREKILLDLFGIVDRNTTIDMKLKFPTGKPVLQAGTVSFSLPKGKADCNVNCQDNAPGRFRITGTEQEERSFNRERNLELVKSLATA
jgi:hypothetical protein